MSKKRIVSITFALLLATVIISGIHIIGWLEEGAQEEAEEQFMIDEFIISSTTEAEEAMASTPETALTPPDDSTADTTAPAAASKPIILDYDKLRAANADAVGWIHVPGTRVNHPVVQGKDNTEYLKKNLYGKKSSIGTPFLDCTNRLEPLDDNLIIYGHNMGTGRTTAFSTLLSYKKQKQWLAYPTVELNLYGETTVWHIFAVFQTSVQTLSEYNYTTHNFLSAEDKEKFIQNAKQRAFYPTDIEVPNSAPILTLSTCDTSRYGKNGRLIIMAFQMS